MSCKRKVTYAEVIEALVAENRLFGKRLDEIEGGGKSPQDKTVTPNIEGQTVEADENYYLRSVTVEPIFNTPEVTAEQDDKTIDFVVPSSGVVVKGTGRPGGKTEVELIVTPTLEEEIYTPDEDTVYNKVTVEGVDRIEHIEGTIEGGTYIFPYPIKGVEISEVMSIEETFLEKIYPVGSLYISTVNKSPALFLGGTWSPMQDKFLIGASNNFPAKTTGGAVSSKQNITGTVGGTSLNTRQLPAHTHPNLFYEENGQSFQLQYGSSGCAYGDYSSHMVPSTVEVPYNKYNVRTGNVGSGEAHTHTLNISSITVPTMPPYISVYMWQRIA